MTSADSKATIDIGPVFKAHRELKLIFEKPRVNLQAVKQDTPVLTFINANEDGLSLVTLVGLHDPFRTIFVGLEDVRTNYDHVRESVAWSYFTRLMETQFAQDYGPMRRGRHILCFLNDREQLIETVAHRVLPAGSYSEWKNPQFKLTASTELSVRMGIANMQNAVETDRIGFILDLVHAEDVSCRDRDKAILVGLHAQFKSARRLTTTKFKLDEPMTKFKLGDLLKTCVLAKHWYYYLLTDYLVRQHSDVQAQSSVSGLPVEVETQPNPAPIKPKTTSKSKQAASVTTSHERRASLRTRAPRSPSTPQPINKRIKKTKNKETPRSVVKRIKDAGRTPGKRKRSSKA